MESLDDILLGLFQEGGSEEFNGFGWSNAETYTKEAKQSIANWVRSKKPRELQYGDDERANHIISVRNAALHEYEQALLADLEDKK